MSLGLLVLNFVGSKKAEETKEASTPQPVKKMQDFLEVFCSSPTFMNLSKERYEELIGELQQWADDNGIMIEWDNEV